MTPEDAQGGITDAADDALVAHDRCGTVSHSTRQRVISAEQSATHKIRRTHAKLYEASNTTLTAASSILDGLDRATVLLDELDANADRAEPASKELRSALRDELMSIMDIMQFQDIASQQLATASSALSQAEERLGNIAHALNGEAFNMFPPEADHSGALPLVFDDHATMEHRAERQAVADHASVHAAGGRGN